MLLKQGFTATCCHNFIWSFLQFYHIEKQSSSGEVHIPENVQYAVAIFYVRLKNKLCVSAHPIYPFLAPTLLIFFCISSPFYTSGLILAVITPTDRPNSVRNCCLIELFVALFVLSLCPFDISVGIGAFVIGLGQISSFLFWLEFIYLIITKIGQGLFKM